MTNAANSRPLTPCNTKYTIDMWEEISRAFVPDKRPGAKKNAKIPVTHVYRYIRVCCVEEGRELFHYKYYKHQGWWYWMDSRDTDEERKKRRLYTLDVVRDLARRLYGGDEYTARKLLERARCNEAKSY